MFENCPQACYCVHAMRKTNKYSLSLILGLLLLAIPSSSALAFSFDKNTLISDLELNNWKYMSVKGVQNFLDEKGSGLADYTTTDVDGKDRTAAQIIKRASKRYQLNPMLFLVMAQKESSAITRSTRTDFIENWTLGFGCFPNCASAESYRGLANQVDSAGYQFRHGYLADLDAKGHTISGWGPGLTKTTSDGIDVTPTNDATAALYTYNPWVGAYGGGDSRYGANSAFQKLWQEWNPATVRYPNGSLLQIGGVVYLIENGQKRAFTSYAALVSNYNPEDIIIVPSLVGEQYKNGPQISFPNYSILRTPNGTVYLFVDGGLRGFSSAEALRQTGINPEEIRDVKKKELKNLPEDDPITADTEYPTGALLQNSKTGAVVYISPEGTRHPIWDRTVMENRFPDKAIRSATPAHIKQFKLKKPLKLADGTLVRSPESSSIYVIANGRKRPFKSAKVFETYGYKWDNVIVVPQKVLDLHSDGSFIRMPKKKDSK